MSTREEYELRFPNGAEPSAAELRDLTAAYNTWKRSKEEDGDEDEIDAAYDLIAQLLDFASIQIDVLEVDTCDECDEEATNFWPNLKKPVQLCDSCEHNARRSGWEPGQ